MPIYSHSRLSCYENCPLQFKFAYIDKVQVEKRESIEAFTGKLIHDTFKSLYDNLKKQNVLKLDDLINIFVKTYNEKWNDSIYINKRAYTRENYFNTAKKALEEYYNTYYPFNQAVVIDTEMQVTFNLDKEGLYRITGFIDRLDKTHDGVFEIHDYKTGNSLPSQKEMDLDRQLALYQIGIHSMWQDMKDVELVWHYVNFNMEIRAKKTQEQLAFLKEKTIKLIDTIESNVKKGNMPAYESGLCNWCDYQFICPRKKHFAAVSQLPENEYLKNTGVELVKKYAEFNEQLSGLNKEYKDHTEKIKNEIIKLEEAMFAYGKKEKLEVLRGSGYSAALEEKTIWKIPNKDDNGRKELEQIIHETGKWGELSDLSAPALSKAIADGKLDENIVTKIKSYCKIETSKKVKLRKEKQE